MIKRTDAAASWYMIDNKRSPENVRDTVLFANLSNAEQQGQSANYYPMNFLENGFELTQAVSDGYNASGGSYIYMAFAADPTTVEPTLEDSFNTVLYSGNGGTQSVTGVGFQPDLAWIKGRVSGASGLTWHLLYDSIRGIDKALASNANNSELSLPSSLTSFNSDGFTLGSDSGVGNTGWNQSGVSYVAWAWKGAELPAINSNGSIPSVVSANPAAGFSIVSYTGSGSSQTMGHGLSDAPKVIIIKNRSGANSWNVYFNGITANNQVLYLNQTIAVATNPSQTIWQTPTNTTIGGGTSADIAISGNNYIAYCFAEVEGFSKFGSYVGQGLGNTTSVNVGFEPAFIMVKCSSRGSSSYDFWLMIDNKRGDTKYLYANTSNAEDTSSTVFEFTANGFNAIGGNVGNATGETFIYMAFANQF